MKPEFLWKLCYEHTLRDAGRNLQIAYRKHGIPGEEEALVSLMRKWLHSYRIMEIP